MAKDACSASSSNADGGNDTHAVDVGEYYDV